KGLNLFWMSLDQPLLQRLDPPAGIDITMYSLLHMAADGAPADRATDAMVHNLAAQQRKQGNWHLAGIARPPMQDGDFTRTAMAIRSLAVYGMQARKPEFNHRIERAAARSLAADPRTNEDRSMQWVGLSCANADGPTSERGANE